MEFSDAASFFNHTPVYDAYTGAYLFDGRTSTHDDHSSSGATSRRRTLTTVPGSVAPARGVVVVHGEQWLVGTSNVDNFNATGEEIRRNFDLKKATHALTRLTPAEAALGLSGTLFYARLEFYRDQTDTMTSADFDTMWNAFCPASEPLDQGIFLRTVEGRVMRVRNVYSAQERLNLAEVDQLDTDARQMATFTVTGDLDLRTDTYPTVTVETYVIRAELNKVFRYRTADEAIYRPGDTAFIVAASVLTPRVGHELTVAGARWRVVSAVPERDAWVLHARLA